METRTRKCNKKKSNEEVAQRKSIKIRSERDEKSVRQRKNRERERQR